MVTVFTPTYNRASCLPKAWESLCKQSCHDFEWVIVDDGSRDDTESVVLAFAKDESTFFPIRYFCQENGGKHRAINWGVKEARGELFLILDSDDSLPCDSLEQVTEYYEQIRNDHSFGGVCGYMAHHDGTIIGRGNDDNILDTNTIDLRYKYHVSGDMCEVFRTSVLREFPFPEIDGEKFCSEALVWNRIARKYRLRVFHKIVYHRDYLEGGLTDRIVRIRMSSPKAAMMTYQEMLAYDIPFLIKLKSAINYWRFRFCGSGNGGDIEISWTWLPIVPIAFVLHRLDLRKNKDLK